MTELPLSFATIADEVVIGAEGWYVCVVCQKVRVKRHRFAGRGLMEGLAG